MSPDVSKKWDFVSVYTGESLPERPTRPVKIPSDNLDTPKRTTSETTISTEQESIHIVVRDTPIEALGVSLRQTFLTTQSRDGRIQVRAKDGDKMFGKRKIRMTPSKDLVDRY